MTSHDRAPALAVCDLGMVLKGATVLSGVTFDIAPGEVVGLLGRNGAGKSSLLHAVAHLRRPTSGSVWVDGAPAGSERARTAMSVVLQSVDFPVAVRVGELLTHVARHYPSPQNPRQVADQLGMGGCWGRQAGGLSGGQERRLALACALVARPRVVVLDEPTAGLDRPGSDQLWSALTDLVADGATVLFSTHLLAEVERHADRVLLLDGGRLIADQPPQHLASSLGLIRVSFTAADDVRALPEPLGSPRITGHGGHWSAFTCQPDEVVRWLVHHNVGFQQLSIEPLDLGDAIDELVLQQSSSVGMR